ncbi:MAG: DNA translocase FtsK 4TM domain-containing protein [Mariprofundales bacterium]|nr:DNA translocase FtsK 4TM domain-containing protein [Mariprofundales bacterium]
MTTRALARESLALLLLAVATLLALALYSFSPHDPSLNHTIDAQHPIEVINMVGLLGAYISDLLYQLFGYGSWMAIVLATTLIVRILFRWQPYAGHWNSLFWLPFTIAIAALIASHGVRFTEAFGTLPAGVGGALGGMLAQQLGTPLNAIGRDILLTALLLSTLVLASRCSLLMLIINCWRGAAWLFQHGKNRAFAAWRRLDERRDRMVGQEQRKKTRANPVLLQTKVEELEIAPAATIEISRRAITDTQSELPLSEPDNSDGTGDKKRFRLPSITLFHSNKERQELSEEALQAMARLLEKKLLDYKVEGKVVAIQPGPVVVQFEFEPSPGTKLSRVVGLQDDLARSMSAVSIRVSGNIAGKNTIGIEMPNNRRQIVLMHEILASKAFSDKKLLLPLALGVNIAGQPVVTDLAKMPHLLVAGTTGSGKSVSVNTMICSMLLTHPPENLRLIMVDPKMLELSVYEDIPHLLVPVVTDPHKANKALAWTVFEMDRRYQLMSLAKVRNLAGYNKAITAGKIESQDGERHEHLPYIVVLIDELADLMMVAGKEVEISICRIAQKARAAGIHLILATQRPSVDVITGLIKANLPSRIAFQVSSRIDSRTILDQMGAEQLLGMGDSLFLDGGREIVRVHGAFISDEEVLELVEHLKRQAPPNYNHAVLEVETESDSEQNANMDEPLDARFDEAVALIAEKGTCSVSMVQRYLRIGYNRASRMVERMEQEGIVTPPGSGGLRKVLSRKEEETL